MSQAGRAGSAGGGSSGIVTIDGDTGSMTGSTVTISGGTTGLTTTAATATMDVTGTLNVAHGGTGDAAFTVYAPVCGGTTTTGVLQSASTGIATSGFVLTSNGNAALPSFKAAAGGPSVYFSATISSATFTNTGGSSYTMLWDTASANVGGGLSLATGVFTAPTTGLYSFSGFMTWENFASTTILMGASVNSATSLLISWYCNPVTMKDLGSNRLAVPFVFSQFLTAADTIEVIMSSADNLTGLGTIGGNVWAQFNGQSVGF